MCNFLLSLEAIFIVFAILSKETRATLETLQQVQLVFRHGLRAPERPYPGDPYDNETLYWPLGFGQLTNVGKKQQYELGKYIRRRYNSLLANGYKSDDFYAVSSESERCIMSMLCNLAGLFPPSRHGHDRWEEQLDWQPIPFATIPRNLDKIIRGSAPCPKYNILWENLLMTKDVKDFNIKNAELYKLIGGHTGESYSYPVNLTTFYEALIIQDAHNMSLPLWTKAVYPSKNSSELLAFAFSLVVRTEQMKRLRGGPLVREMLTHIQNLIDDSTTVESEEKTLQARKKKKQGKKVIMYSGHDITLVRLMDTLNIFDPHLPDFNSMIMIELHQNKTMVTEKNGGFYIEIFYRYGTSENPVKMEIADCPSPCFVTKLKELFQARILTDEQWENECLVFAKEKAKPTSRFSSGFWNNFYEALRWLV